MKPLPLAPLSPLAAILLLAGPAATGAPPEDPGAAARKATFEDLSLELEAPPLENLRRIDKEGQVRVIWTGKLGRSDVVLRLEVLRRDQIGLSEPDELLSLVAADVTAEGGGSGVVFDAQGCKEGEYGWAPFAVLGRAQRFAEGGTHVEEERRYLCGLLPEHGYVVSAVCTPPPLDKDAKPLEEFFEKGVRYTGEKRNWEWTDEEAEERFRRDTPEDIHDDFEDVVRTDHYIVLTNSSAGKLFAKKMEEAYAKVKKTFPFDECGQRRLLPVFLFRTPEQYYEFCEKVAGWPRATAVLSKGHAWRDYYATWYEAPNDPVHVHEATHQIFSNRIGLVGGGSWFQEGLAEYVETRENDRNAIATQVKKGRHMPLRQFVQIQTLAFEGGGSSAGDLYKQAALLIEFLHDSKFGKKGFDEFLRTMGQVQRGDVEAIEQVFKSVYGVDLDELDQAFQDYCKKR